MLEVLLGNVWVRSLLVLLLLLIGALLGALAWHDHQNDPWMGEISCHNLPQKWKCCDTLTLSKQISPLFVSGANALTYKNINIRESASK